MQGEGERDATVPAHVPGQNTARYRTPAVTDLVPEKRTIHHVVHCLELRCHRIELTCALTLPKLVLCEELLKPHWEVATCTLGHWSATSVVLRSLVHVAGNELASKRVHAAPVDEREEDALVTPGLLPVRVAEVSALLQEYIPQAPNQRWRSTRRA